MKIDIFNIEKFIKVNSCPEVTNSLYMSKDGVPIEDGLFSLSLFGRYGSYDRRTIFGYIDLKRKFIHPQIFKILYSLHRNILKIIKGELYVTINGKGEIVGDEAHGRTGLDFIIDNWSSIKWKKTGSPTRDEKVALLKNLKPEEIFITKWLVIPPHYRDININMSDNSKSTSIDEINSYYINIINGIKFLNISKNSSFTFVMNNTLYKIQNHINTCYDYLIGSIPGKRGLLAKNLLGKVVDYSTRNVISAASTDSNTADSQLIPFKYAGIPLSSAINLFFPFVQNEFKKFVNDSLLHIKMPEFTNEDIDAIKIYFTSDRIKKIFNQYISTTHIRLKPLKIPLPPKRGRKAKGVILSFKYLGIKDEPLTLTEVLYIITQRVVKNKTVYVKRYPVEDDHSTLPCKIKLLSTIKTKKIEIQGEVFENYPDIENLKGLNIESIFYDTMLVNISYLTGLYADFDGDTMGEHGTFSVEANKEAEEIINSKKYLMDMNGRIDRIFTDKEPILALYNFTK